jgi:hypothetical protein
MQIEVSNGEIVDKLTIIEIKLKHIDDEHKIENLKKEQAVLQDAVKNIFGALFAEHPLYQALMDVNLALWHIEDKCRSLEALKQFDQEFIDVARSVYITNDERARIKKEINRVTGSHLTEEKSYQ